MIETPKKPYFEGFPVVDLKHGGRLSITSGMCAFEDTTVEDA